MNNIYVLGSINMDVVMKTSRIPEKGETLRGEGLIFNPGGKGANQAVAASKSGAKTTFIGAVGNDAFAGELIKSLQEANVNLSISTLSNTKTGIAIILLCQNDNRILLESGSNEKLTQEMVDQGLKEAQEDDYLIMQLETNLDVVFYGLKKAKEKKMITILNPAPARKLPEDWYQFIDLLIVNETECEQLSGIKATSSREAYESLHRYGLKSLLITLGDKGSVYYDDNGEIIQKPYKVIACDTTAAGDTFVGALASRLAKKKSINEALDYASAASALTVTNYGAQKSIPWKKEVLSFIKSY